jgi:hypothetical protein
MKIFDRPEAPPGWRSGKRIGNEISIGGEEAGHGAKSLTYKEFEGQGREVAPVLAGSGT